MGVGLTCPVYGRVTLQPPEWIRTTNISGKSLESTERQSVRNLINPKLHLTKPEMQYIKIQHWSWTNITPFVKSSLSFKLAVGNSFIKRRETHKRESDLRKGKFMNYLFILVGFLFLYIINMDIETVDPRGRG